MYDYSGLSFQHIQYFITVAELGMMSKASEVLHVSPSLLSQKISQMENLIGVELFQRTRHRLALTPAGKQLLVDFKDIQSQLYHAVDSAREQYCTKKSLILGFTTTMDWGLAEYFLQNFKKSYPDLSFGVEILPRKQLEMDFMDNKIDIIVFADFDKLRQNSAVISRIAHMCPVECYVNASMPIASRDKITWKDLDNSTCVLPDHFRNSAFTRELKRKFNEENITVSVQFYHGDLTTVHRLVTLNDYITFSAFRPVDNVNLQCYIMPNLSYPLLIAYLAEADKEVSVYADTLYDIIYRYYRQES